MDVTPRLLELIKKDFNEKLNKSNEIKSLLEILNSGNATYKDANSYAIAIGNILSESLQANITGGVLPDEKMYFNIADRILRDTLGENYNLSSTYAVEVQNILNSNAGLHILGQKADFNEDRIYGLINRLANADKFEDIAWILGEPIVNFTQSVVDDTVKKNFEFHNKLGLKPKIVRSTRGKCCDWCSQKAGTYDYEDVKATGSDVYRRHRHCDCDVTFQAGDGKKQDVWSKQWR